MKVVIIGSTFSAGIMSFSCSFSLFCRNETRSAGVRHVFAQRKQGGEVSIPDGTILLKFSFLTNVPF